MLKNKTLSSNTTTYLQENCRVDIPIGKNRKNKELGYAVMPEDVQKELLKSCGIESHGSIIIIEEAMSAPHREVQQKL